MTESWQVNRGARFLVTGGAGFLGSHLCDALLERGGRVIAIDNYSSGRFENIRHLFSHGDFTFIEKDITQGIDLATGLAGIFHLASPASPPYYQKHPVETLDVGSLGTRHCLELAKEKDCPILVASTSEIYGDPLVHPQTEDYFGNVNPIGIRSCYDEAKRFLEAMTMAYHRTFRLKTQIVRIFNTYGPRLSSGDGRVVSNFCVQALEGRPLTVYGSGSQTRSFCYVSDLIEGILRAFFRGDSLPINLGNPSETTVLELAKMVAELSGVPLKIERGSAPIDDPQRRRPSIDRAKSLLSWEPKVALREGLIRTLDYFKTMPNPQGIPG